MVSPHERGVAFCSATEVASIQPGATHGPARGMLSLPAVYGVRASDQRHSFTAIERRDLISLGELG